MFGRDFSPKNGRDLSSKVFVGDSSFSFFGRESLFRDSLVHLFFFARKMPRERRFLVEIVLHMFLANNVSSELPWQNFFEIILGKKILEKFFFSEFWVGMVLQIFFSRGFFRNLFEREFYSKYVW